MKKILFIAIALFTAAWTSAQLRQQNHQMKIVPAQKLGFVEQIIEQYYVDTVNGNKIVDEAITAMLRTLDPHSTYSDAETTRALTEPLQGNFSGIGIQFNMLDDTIRVIQAVAGGPSEKVGILAGDKIMAANDTMLSGVKMPQADVMRKLRGPKGSEVDIKVLRRGVTDTISFRIIRDDIPTYSVSAAYMADPATGYIKVTLFGETTANEVRQAIDRLRKQGMTQLILDLEDNGGGYLGAAVELAGMFLDKDDLIVYTDGLHTEPAYYRNPDKGIMTDGRLIITVNQFSASASEILSGAMQDNDRGVVVGRRTFGKGLVQRPFPFPDGSMIRLTTARYYTPSGRSIQKPYTAGDEDEYNADMMRRYRAGEFMSADSVHFADSLRRETIRLHRPVYGGGGIMPDAFVPIDTTYYSDYYRNLVARGILNRFAINYIDINRKQLKADYPDEDSFIAKFEITSAMLDSFIALADKEGVEYNAEQYEISKPAIRIILKGLIGRDLFEQSTYYRVANSLNPVYRRAIDLINSTADYTTILSAPDK